MIASTANPQVKNLVRLQKKAKARRQQGVYVAEGVHMFREAPADRICGIYVSESFFAQPDSAELLDKKRQRGGLPSGASYEVLSDAVFDYVSDTKTPQGILCLVRMQEYSPDEVLDGAAEEPPAADDPGGKPTAAGTDVGSAHGLWLVLESLQDPGNLGTIFRTAEGAGVTGIVMDPFTADPYSPKTIRSTMGSIYRVPFCVADDLTEILAAMHARGIRVFAASGNGGAVYTTQDYTGPAAFLIGNEGSGLSDAAMAAADASVCIPMRGQLESLNASAAAGILLYEADRQRRKQK